MVFLILPFHWISSREKSFRLMILLIFDWPVAAGSLTCIGDLSIGLLSKNPVSNNWIQNFCMVDHYSPQNTCVSSVVVSDFQSTIVLCYIYYYGQQSSGWCWTGGLQGCMASQCSVPVIDALLFSLLYTSDGLIWSHGAAAKEKYMYWPLLLLTDDHLWLLASRSQNNHHLISFYLLCINTETNCSQ